MIPVYFQIHVISFHFPIFVNDICNNRVVHGQFCCGLCKQQWNEIKSAAELKMSPRRSPRTPPEKSAVESAADFAGKVRGGL